MNHDQNNTEYLPDIDNYFYVHRKQNVLSQNKHRFMNDNR